MSQFDGWIDKAMGELTKVFGDNITYKFKPDFDTSFIIKAIFNAAGTVIDTTGDIAVESKHPVLCIRKSDFINQGFRLPLKGDWAVINDMDYEVVEIPNDGLSEMRLVLMIRGKNRYAR